jgi:hypothetical protein
VGISSLSGASPALVINAEEKMWRLAQTHTPVVEACVVATYSPPGETASEVGGSSTRYLPH